MKSVLFLCTGNYYRSRFAEHYFNAIAARRRLGWRAESRGLQLWPDNIGAISQHTLVCLRSHGVGFDEPHRHPLAVIEADLQRADLIVAVKEAEHRPLLARDFPEWAERVEYWHVHDIDFATPDEALPELTVHLDALLARLMRTSAGHT